ncbi:MAG: tetratricopeptide repeat protein [Ignavibacteria bacterium]
MIIIAVIIVICIFVYKEFNKDKVVIEVFQVPMDLEKQNITGQAVVNKLLDNIVKIESQADTSFPLLDFNPVMYDAQMEIVIPGSGISINSLIRHVKNFLGKKQIKITGEIVLSDKKINLTTRIVGEPSMTFTGDLNTIDSLIYESAKYIILYTQPYMLAYYYYYSYGSDHLNTKLAMDMINHSITHPPETDDVMAYTLYGYILSDQEKYEESINMYENALEIDPNFTDAISGWAYSLFEMNKFEESEEMYKKALKTDPDDSYTYYYYAMLKEKTKSFSEADSLYKKAVSLDANNFEAANDYSNFLISQNRISDAKISLKNILRIRPDNSQAYFNLGILNYIENKPEESVNNYLKSYNLDSSNIISLLKASKILSEIDRNDEALDLAKEIDLKKNYDNQTTKEIGILLENLDKRSEYNELYKKAVKQFPQDSAYFRSRIVN